MSDFLLKTFVFFLPCGTLNMFFLKKLTRFHTLKHFFPSEFLFLLPTLFFVYFPDYLYILFFVKLSEIFYVSHMKNTFSLGFTHEFF